MYLGDQILGLLLNLLPSLHSVYTLFLDTLISQVSMQTLPPQGQLPTQQLLLSGHAELLTHVYNMVSCG